jgi:hypothetical protein
LKTVRNEEAKDMARVSYVDIEGSAMRRIIGHNPDLLAAWNEVAAIVPRRLSLSAELCEQVRAVLAQTRGCAY